MAEIDVSIIGNAPLKAAQAAQATFQAQNLATQLQTQQNVRGALGGLFQQTETPTTQQAVAALAQGGVPEEAFKLQQADTKQRIKTKMGIVERAIGAVGNNPLAISAILKGFTDDEDLLRVATQLGTFEPTPDTRADMLTRQSGAAAILVSDKATGRPIALDGQPVPEGATAESLGLQRSAITDELLAGRLKLKTEEAGREVVVKRRADLKFGLPAVIRTDPQLKKAEDMINVASRLDGLLQEDKPGTQTFANNLSILARQLARVSGEQRLTDFDVKSFEGNPTLARKFEQAWEKNFGAGSFTQFNADEYRKIVNFLNDNARQVRQGVAVRAARSAASQLTDTGQVEDEDFNELFNTAQEVIGERFDPNKLGVAAQIAAGIGLRSFNSTEEGLRIVNKGESFIVNGKRFRKQRKAK